MRRATRDPLPRTVEFTGITEVRLALAQTRGGRIRPRVAPVKAVASAITIGSGGSVGREGPIVQMGATLGSVVGQLSGLAPEQTKLLLACGAAGGIGATFNAPIAGVLFALEVILGSFAARSFGLVVIASVAATALSHAALGPDPAFIVRPFALVSVQELPLYLLAPLPGSWPRRMCGASTASRLPSSGGARRRPSRRARAGWP